MREGGHEDILRRGRRRNSVQAPVIDLANTNRDDGDTATTQPVGGGHRQLRFVAVAIRHQNYDTVGSSPSSVRRHEHVAGDEIKGAPGCGALFWSERSSSISNRISIEKNA